MGKGKLHRQVPARKWWSRAVDHMEIPEYQVNQAVFLFGEAAESIHCRSSEEGRSIGRERMDEMLTGQKNSANCLRYW